MSTCSDAPAVPGIWNVARGAWPNPRHEENFSTPEKNLFQNFFDRMNSINLFFRDFGNFFSGRWRSWRQTQAQGQWSHRAMTCACGMCVHCPFTAGTCQFCPAMSEGESKHSDFCNKRVQYCKNALLRFQRSKKEISIRKFRFQSAKFNFQVPLKTQVHSPAYNNRTEP